MRSNTSKTCAVVLAMLMMLACSCMPASRAQRKEFGNINSPNAGSRSAKLFAPPPVGERIQMQ
ncbi:MAG TPA: hypothetical protein VF490_07240 [Chryseosolibacter sp.]